MDFIKAYDLVTIGMRLAYLDMAGHLEIHTTTSGEEELTEFAIDLSKKWNAFHKKHEDVTRDEYIEEAIIKKYGRYNHDHT